jgi:DNA-binding response OmpR family regulator
MATVLILATDRMIGGLLGQLTELTGHSAQFRRDGEEASAAVTEERPDVVLLDAAYAGSTLDLVAAAASRVGAAVVYFSSMLPANELRRFALERGAKYFALPAGPKLLARVLADALSTRRHPAAPANVQPSGEAAIAAAAAAVLRAKLLAERANVIRAESRLLRAEREAALAEGRRSHAELREAVIAYTRELRGAGVPPDRTLELVREAVRLHARDSGAYPARDAALDDALEWCLQAYYAA